MLSLSFIPPPRLHHDPTLPVRKLAVRVFWPRFISPRAEFVGSPSLARPNLFAGD